MTKPAKPTAPVVTSAGTTATVTAAATGTVYILRAPSFGEVGEMTARVVADSLAPPNDAIFAEALRKAAQATLPEAESADAIAAVDAHEEAQDHLDSLYAAHGTDRTAWDADVKREFRDAQRAQFAAQRARQKLEYRLRAHPDLVALRRHQVDARQREAADLVALCVFSIGGREKQLSPDDVLALPAGDVALVAERAQAMIRPTAAAEKN